MNLTHSETRQVNESELTTDIQPKVDSLTPSELSRAEALVFVKPSSLLVLGVSPPNFAQPRSLIFHANLVK
jgi:hypothetical protein